MNITEIRNTKIGNFEYQKFVPDAMEQPKIKDIRTKKEVQILDKNDVKM